MDKKDEQEQKAAQACTAFTPESGARKKIGERLRSVRESWGKTQNEFADWIGMPRTSYKDYERGKRIPGGLALARLARAGIDAKRLFGDLGLEAAAAREEHTGDHVAEERATYRVRTVGQSVRESRETVERVERALGFVPSMLWHQTLITLVYVHGLDAEGVERIVDLLKQEQGVK